jgi:ribosomal protein L35AE/L33A
MTVLRIEHPVPNFEAWKEAFDGDPVGRERAGVRGYRILRATDDPNYVMIDLEFDGAAEAEALLASLRVLWERVQGTVISDPRARIVDVVETVQYRRRRGSGTSPAPPHPEEGR